MRKIFAAMALAFLASAAWADSTTTRIGITKPTIGSSTWGTKLNTDFDILDASAALQGAYNNFTASNTFSGSTFTVTAASISLGVGGSTITVTAASTTWLGNFSSTGVISGTHTGNGSGLTGLTLTAGSVGTTQIIDSTVALVDLNTASVDTRYVTTGTAQTVSGAKTFSTSLAVNGDFIGSTNIDVLAGAPTSLFEGGGASYSIRATSGILSDTNGFFGIGKNLTQLTAANISAGSLGASVITSSIAQAAVGVSQMNFSGTPSTFTFARGDGVWVTPSGSGIGDVVAAATQTFTGGNTFNSWTVFSGSVSAANPLNTVAVATITSGANLGVIGQWDGWVASTAAFTRLGASSMTASGNWGGVYQSGDKVKFVDGGVAKYGVLATTPAFTASLTTFTFVSNSDYSLLNNPSTVFFSKMENPGGFPDWFSYPVTLTGVTTSPTNGTNGASFSVGGRTMRIIFRVTYTAEGSGIYLVTVPTNVTINTAVFTTSALVDADGGANSFGAIVGSATMDNSGGVFSRENYKIVIYSSTRLALVRGSQAGDPQNRTDVLGSADNLTVAVGGTIGASGNAIFLLQ